MGYWNAARDGTSLHVEDTGLIWGDSPADILDEAIDKIREQFREEIGREPTLAELRAGLEFSLQGFPDETSAERLDN